MDKQVPGPAGTGKRLQQRMSETVRVPPAAQRVFRAAAWGVLLYGLAAPIIRLSVGYDSIGFIVTLATALAALLWVVPRGHAVRTWVFYAVSMYFFTQLRDAADETSIKASTGYVLDWELWMFNGTTPSAWLQAHAGGADGNPGPLAFFSAFVHWSWFVFPHAVVIGTFFLARRLFFRVAVIMAGTFFFAVALYYLAPTVPPWLAVEEGATTDIRRLMDDVGPTLFGTGLWDNIVEAVADPNPRAAMPSLHFAASFVVLIIAFILRSRRLFVGALLYSTALAFALVYLGEHYVADIIAGGAAGAAAAFIAESALGNGPGLRGLSRFVRAVLRRSGEEGPASRGAGRPLLKQRAGTVKPPAGAAR